CCQHSSRSTTPRCEPPQLTSHRPPRSTGTTSSSGSPTASPETLPFAQQLMPSHGVASYAQARSAVVSHANDTPTPDPQIEKPPPRACSIQPSSIGPPRVRLQSAPVGVCSPPDPSSKVNHIPV